MSQKPKKPAQSNSIRDFEAIRKQSVNKKIESLIQQYPISFQNVARKLIEHAGLESNDLLFWDMANDAYKAKHLVKIIENQTLLLNRYSQLHRKLGGVHELTKGIASRTQVQDLQTRTNLMALGQKGLASSRQVEKLQTTFDKILTNQKKPKATQRKLSLKQIWREWIQSPQGITSSVIVALMLLNLIF